MQSIALARALAMHRTKPQAPALLKEPVAAPRSHVALLAAVCRQAGTQPRTMMEMARDREAVRRPWWER